jgi:hypothetical protein
LPETNLKNKYPAEQKNQRMNQTPNPSHRRPDKALLEIAAHQLEQQAAPFYQIPQKEGSRNSSAHGQCQQYQFYQRLAMVDFTVMMLLQFEIR